MIYKNFLKYFWSYDLKIVFLKKNRQQYLESK